MTKYVFSIIPPTPILIYEGVRVRGIIEKTTTPPHYPHPHIYVFSIIPSTPTLIH
jgi:hypothetical protein